MVPLACTVMLSFKDVLKALVVPIGEDEIAESGILCYITAHIHIRRGGSSDA